MVQKSQTTTWDGPKTLDNNGHKLPTSTGERRISSINSIKVSYTYVRCIILLAYSKSPKLTKTGRYELTKVDLRGEKVPQKYSRNGGLDWLIDRDP